MPGSRRRHSIGEISRDAEVGEKGDGNEIMKENKAGDLKIDNMRGPSNKRSRGPSESNCMICDVVLSQDEPEVEC